MDPRGPRKELCIFGAPRAFQNIESEITKIPDTYNILQQLIIHDSKMISLPKEVTNNLTSIDLDDCPNITSIGGNTYSNLSSILVKKAEILYVSFGS